jgi:UTP--glucose-1-phosphate uridylyltransferase
MIARIIESLPKLLLLGNESGTWRLRQSLLHFGFGEYNVLLLHWAVFTEAELLSLLLWVFLLHVEEARIRRANKLYQNNIFLSHGLFLRVLSIAQQAVLRMGLSLKLECMCYTLLSESQAAYASICMEFCAVACATAVMRVSYARFACPVLQVCIRNTMAYQMIKTAVFPVGGFGTRFLPATKSIPKEMLPVVDKPIIHYAVEEAMAAGIERFVFITARGKESIEDYFDLGGEIIQFLKDKGKEAEALAVDAMLPPQGKMLFVRQGAPNGLGHAIWCAREAVGNAPFAVILPDDLVLADVPCIKQMVDAYAALPTPGNMAAVVEVPAEHTRRYGILKINADAKLPSPRLVQATGLVEKPAPEVAPSRLSIVGRYILQPSIFTALDKQQQGNGGEVQLTDAMDQSLPGTAFYGYAYEGVRYDCGDKAGYIAANLAVALSRDDLADDVRASARALLA